MLHYVVGLLIIIVIWGVLKFVRWYNEVYCCLEKIGGPKVYPFIGTLYLFFGAKRSDFFKRFIELNLKYGPMFRSYNGFQHEINIQSPQQIEVIMNSSVHIDKSDIYNVMKEFIGDGLLISSGTKWRARRKMITPTFHFKILENFMNVFVEKGRILLNHLDKEANGGCFNIYPYITHCTLDIICETAMGVSINAMDDQNNLYTKAIYNSGELIIKRQLSLLQQTRIFPFLKDGKEFYNNIKIMHDFTHKVISDRREYLKHNPIKIEENEISQKARLSFLDLLLETSLNDADIRAEVDTFMVAGHDTTTSGICWSLFLFGLNQDIQEKAFQEIKNVLGEKDSPETISDLNELKYLECCIKETLRIYPSVPTIGRKITEEITIDGFQIPKGTDILIHIFEIHRNPEIYPNPKKFDPDRFLPENCKNRHPYAYVPFSAGPRNCIGQKFAMYEEKTLLATILKKFRVIPVDTLDTINIVSEIVLKPEGGLKIALEKRK